MSHVYSNFGSDGCTCISEVCRCHSCGARLSEDDGMFCDECEREMREENDTKTNFLLDELEGFVTNL